MLSIMASELDFVELIGEKEAFEIQAWVSIHLGHVGRVKSI